MKDIRTFISEQYLICAVFGTTENATEMAKKTAGEIVEYGYALGEDPMATVLLAVKSAMLHTEIDKSGVFMKLVDIWKKCLAEVFGIACAF